MLTLMIVAGLAYWYFNSQVSQTNEADTGNSHVAITQRQNFGHSLARTIAQLIVRARQPHAS